MNQYRKLLTKRNNAATALKYHEKKVKEMKDDASYLLALNRLTEVEHSFERFKQVVNQLEDCNEYDPNDMDPPTEEINEIYITTHATLKSYVKQHGETSMFNSTTARTSTSEKRVKLPEIRIQPFDGNYQMWATFYDSFTSVFDADADLSDVDKMHYLKSYLRGTALKVISSLPTSEQNYRLAWNPLKDRFHNRRAIVNSALKKFINQEKMLTHDANSVRNLIDTTKESISGLEMFEIDITEWDSIIVYIVQTKMDIEIRNLWEKHLGGSTKIPKYSEVIAFLEMQFRILDNSEYLPKEKPIMSSYKPNINRNDNQIASTSQRNENCCVCKENHWIFFCPVFDSWSVSERRKYIRENDHCFICLKSHKQEQCRSKYRCKICHGEHNTKLHEDNSTSIHMVQTDYESSSSRDKLLATAIVKVKDKFGITHLLRAFIDMGSEGIAISERATQLLCLNRKKVNIPLTGLDEQPLGKVTNTVQIQVSSIVDETFTMSLEALVTNTIITPRKHFESQKKWKHLDNIALADPDFTNPSQIDLLLGEDIYALIIINGLRKGSPNQPIGQNTSLGWLVFGAISKKNNYSVQMNHLSLTDQLRRFWENEEISEEPILTEEQQTCTEQCEKSIKRLPNGKLEISIPFNKNPNDDDFLGDSRKMAMRRLSHLEKKFEKNHEFYERYKADMLSYLQLNHMNISKSPLNKGYYLPHHAIVREESLTTKQRTVFDASAKSSNGYSLNDRCRNGPTIQPELFDIFIRWRMNKIALAADIEKMYRQISVAPEDRKYQKILWRFSKDEPIQTYELNTVTFGVKSAPFMAIFATFYLADQEKNKYPEASKRVKTDFYVDDCMSGSHSTASAKNLQIELTSLFSSAHLCLRKWASNDEAALEGIPLEHRALSSSLNVKLSETVKTLGMKWTPKTDELHFTINWNDLSSESRMTKRQLLSDASKLYDPCGILSPITVKSKIMMQEVWKAGADWDDFVPDVIQKEWSEYKQELPIIESIKINRWLTALPFSSIQLHGFCDSSERAYAAVIYLVQTINNITTSMLICSKTKVAPLNSESIPRLELCGAVLLAKLMKRVATNLKIDNESVHLWTDSSCVLDWLNSHPSRWQTYVSHRVSTIHKLYKACHWRHVRTHDNPADIASRGVLASQLKDNNLWFFGPNWLVMSKEHWPKLKILPITSHSEEKIRMNVISQPPQEMEILKRFSSFTRLLRVTVYIFRFIRILRREEELKYSNDPITYQELQMVKIRWIKYIQALHFAEEIKYLRANKPISSQSTIRQLNPQMNEENVLIVCGRLQHSQLSQSSKFPAIIPARSHFTELIIERAHKVTLHGTIHLSLAKTRQEFWIINGRNLVKAFIHKCITCFRQKPKPMNQLMAPLPRFKTTPARAFIHCGLDFAGPIEIKSANKRNAPTEKGYICVFVCMVSKSAHLELVGDLSTQKFIMALRRLVSRRGLCTNIYCDRGTNFQGANNELPLLFMQAKSSVAQEIANTLAADGINFNFNPPSAPNWGGQWESFVKLTKHHLKRMNTSIKLTYEEMSTLLIQIECCINSRPLCAITNDINDLNPLTAGHLLIGSPLNLIPEPSLLSLKDNTLNRFQAIQKSLQIFWKRFHIEYLHTLHPRKKWQQTQDEIAINDLVVIIEDNMPPAKWLLARVLKVHHGADNLIRLATLRTRNGELQRPIVKLCRLPLESSPAPENVPNGTNK